MKRKIDSIKVVGKTLPVDIYELVCFKEDITPEIEKCIIPSTPCTKIQVPIDGIINLAGRSKATKGTTIIPINNPNLSPLNTGDPPKLVFGYIIENAIPVTIV